MKLAWPGWLVLALAAAPPASAQETARPAADTARVRLVVFQFEALPNDSAHRAWASTFSRALVRAFVADTALKVMTHPRASQDRSAAGNAQYGILGGLADRAGRLRFDLRIADIAAVRLVWRDTASVSDTSSESITTAARELAGRVSAQLTARADSQP